MRGQLEFVERIVGKKTRAVDGYTDRVVFFEQDHVMSGRGRDARGHESGRTSAYDGSVTHVRLWPLILRSDRQSFRARTSHVPGT